MVEEKTVAGKTELGASFSQCRVEVGDISVGTFRKLARVQEHHQGDHGNVGCSPIVLCIIM